ncbi:MAG: nitrilase-related carbon-nitrogen hydrolase [Candidatus Eisenbacteria bacterium]
MRVGVVQIQPVFGDAEANVRLVKEAIGQRRADLWVLPELFSTGYLFGNRETLERLAEPVPQGPTARALIDLAGRLDAAFVAGIAERAPSGRIYNASIAVDATGIRGIYRKVHLFDREVLWFDSGDLPFSVVDLRGARVGMMICFDWIYPEAARTLTLLGAQVIAHPSNLVLPFCQSAMVTRALENRVFTVTTNRIGAEERGGVRLEFTGGSRIVGPRGAVLADAPGAEPAAIAVDIDPAEADEKHATPRNHLLLGRRPDFYKIG